MCLVLLSFQTKPGYKLILAANRDEFLARPTAPLDYWDSDKRILAGRDLEAGGTWLGVNDRGRIAVLTNFREGVQRPGSFASRGEIVEEYLRWQGEVDAFSSSCLVGAAQKYRGFNLIYGDGDALYYFSNKTRATVRLFAGVHGLSNGLLDSRWPKVERGKRLMKSALAAGKVSQSAFFDLLEDTRQPQDAELPDTGVGMEWERLLGPMHIQGEHYGTRSAAVVMMREDGSVTFCERTYSGDPRKTEEREFVVLRRQDATFQGE